MSRNVIVNAGGARYIQNISVGPHLLHADEESIVGGKDAGPDPYELLLATLGACASITVRMYADRKQWSLDGVHIELSHAKVHAEDCAKCDTELRTVDRIEIAISFFGKLSEEQRLRLLEIAERCPVHRTLTSQIQISSRHTGGGAPSP